MKDFEDLSSEQRQRFENYVRWFVKSQREILQDYNNNLKNLTELSRYTVSELVTMLKNPVTETNQKQIRKLSQFLYQVSSHYKILVNYYANILLYNYTLTPSTSALIIGEEFDINDYRLVYAQLADQVEKYDFKHLCSLMIRIAVRDGAFYGLCFESNNAFYVDRWDPDYARITSVEDGVIKFSMDLDFFSRKTYLLENYGKDVQKAYLEYKGDRERGIAGNTKARWYEPKNSICIMADNSDYSIVLPLFTGLLKDIFDIEDYRLIKKANDENANYKAVTMQVETDEDGVPLMNDVLIKKYYDQTCNNVPEGVGVIINPFKTDSLSFNNGRNNDTKELADAESQFWFDSGTSPLLFGSAKATSAGSLGLSVKPNEKIAFNMLMQIEKTFNQRIQNFHKIYKFKIKFSNISIFNEIDIANKDLKAASYGVAGAKLRYASDLGMTPSDIICNQFLEDTVLGLTINSWDKPLISSNVQSGSSSTNVNPDDTSTGLNGAGRPRESVGELTESGETSREYE